MQKLLAWLSREPRGPERYVLPIVALAVDVIVTIPLSLLLDHFGVLGEGISVGLPILSLASVLFVVFAAFGEELLLRTLPLGVAIRRIGVAWQTIVIAILSAMIFGALHGSLWNILSQGVGGFFYAIVFIKFAAERRRYARATLITTGMHIAFNGILLLFLLAAGETQW